MALVAGWLVVLSTVTVEEVPGVNISVEVGAV